MAGRYGEPLLLEAVRQLEAGLVCIVSPCDDSKPRRREPAAMPTTTCWYRRTPHLPSLSLTMARTAADDRTAARSASGGWCSVFVYCMRLVSLSGSR